MDVIESSHFEVVKQWLQDNPRYEFKVRSYVDNGMRMWECRIRHSNYDVKSPTEFHSTNFSFGSALKSLSKLISPGGTHERSSDS